MENPASLFRKTPEDTLADEVAASGHGKRSSGIRNEAVHRGDISKDTQIQGLARWGEWRFDVQQM